MRGEQLISGAKLGLSAGLVGVLFLAAPRDTSPWAAGIATLLLVVSAIRREWAAGHIFVLIGASSAVAMVPALQIWPFHFLVPLLLYLAVCRLVNPLRRTLQWFSFGSFDRRVLALVFGSAVASLGCLWAWVSISGPDMNALMGQFPSMPTWAVPVVGLGFAGLNSGLEEAIFRGILQGALTSATGSRWTGITGQAVLFGALHYPSGAFPHGASGCVLTFVYGWFLGYVRWRSQGLLAPWAAHALADVVVFVLVGLAANGQAT